MIRLSLREQGANTTTRIYPFFQSDDFLMIFCLILGSMYVEMCCLTNDIHDYVFVSQGKTTIPNVDDGEECTLTDVRTRRSCHLRDYASLTLNLSLSLSLSLSLCRLLSLPPLLPLPPLILAIRQQHHLHHSAWNYSFTASLILLFVIFLYFDLDSIPLLVGSFVVSQEIRRSEKYEGYVRTKFSWRKIFITIFVSFSTWQRSLINYVNQRPFKAQDFFSIVRISSSPQQESRWGGAKREENGISKSCIPYAAYFIPVF